MLSDDPFVFAVQFGCAFGACCVFVEVAIDAVLRPYMQKKAERESRDRINRLFNAGTGQRNYDTTPPGE